MSNRDRQVQNLKHYFPSIVTVANDCYDIPFNLPSRPQTNFTLRVLFPLGFPHDAPKLQLWPRFSPSQILDENGFVHPHAHKGLSEWGSGSSLGLVAFEMIKLFDVNPPVPVGSHPASQRPSQSMPTLSRDSKPLHQPLHQPQPQPQQQQQPQPQPLLQPPEMISLRPLASPVPDSFPELERLSLEEIESLMNDEKEFDSFFLTYEGVKQLKRDGEEVKKVNNDLARKNLDLFESIGFMKAEVEMKQVELAAGLEEFKGKERELKELSSTHSPEGLMEKMEEYVQEADERSEELSEKLMRGEVDFDEFLKLFMKEREMYHTLAAKKESLELYMLSQEANN